MKKITEDSLKIGMKKNDNFDSGYVLVPYLV